MEEMAKGLAASCRVLARNLYLGDHAGQILAHLEVAVGAHDSELLLLGHESRVVALIRAVAMESENKNRLGLLAPAYFL